MLDEQYARTFWRRAKKQPDGCWLYTTSVGKLGYGVVRIGPKPQKSLAAHRVAYELTHGPIPPGMYICHRCDVRNCVNPEHLFIGSPTANRLDCKRKGRDTQPPRNPAPKLSEADVLEVRRLRRDGLTLLAIADRFGVSFSHVGAICRGTSRAESAR